MSTVGLPFSVLIDSVLRNGDHNLKHRSFINFASHVDGSVHCFDLSFYQKKTETFSFNTRVKSLIEIKDLSLSVPHVYSKSVVCNFDIRRLFIFSRTNSNLQWSNWIGILYRVMKQVVEYAVKV